MTMEEESSTVTVSMEEDDELAVLELPPGFRFHPTDEELITHYLSPKVADHTFSPIAIGEVDFNKVEPWDLPWRAKMGEKEWYFFCVKDRKYPTGSRTNRATVAGYWKATGKDKEIYYNSKSTLVVVGMKKTLVFYKGRAPNGEKTNWVMHEYRLVEEGNTTFNHHHTLTNTAQSEWVISRIFKKCSGGKKEHISGLTMDAKHTDIASILPPLMDSSSDELANRAAASSSHDQLISPVSLHFPRASTPNLLFPAQTLPFVENLQYTDSILEQEQSIWRLLLDAQNAKANFSQDSTADVSSINSTDLDILWNF